MSEENLNYYCDSSFQKSDDDKWIALMNIVLPEADFVVFNVRCKITKEFPEIENLAMYIIDMDIPKRKIYPRKKFMSFKLHEVVKDFIISKRYIDWKYYCLEDISMYKNEIEVFATITHENYVIMLLNEIEKDDLNSKGYNFDFFLPLHYSD